MRGALGAASAKAALYGTSSIPSAKPMHPTRGTPLLGGGGEGPFRWRKVVVEGRLAVCGGVDKELDGVDVDRKPESLGTNDLPGQVRFYHLTTGFLITMNKIIRILIINYY
jgi:hypothetical protein